MQTGNLLLLLIVMVALAYYLGHQRSLALARPLGASATSTPCHSITPCARPCGAPCRPC